MHAHAHAHTHMHTHARAHMHTCAHGPLVVVGCGRAFIVARNRSHRATNMAWSVAGSAHGQHVATCRHVATQHNSLADGVVCGRLSFGSHSQLGIGTSERVRLGASASPSSLMLLSSPPMHDREKWLLKLREMMLPSSAPAHIDEDLLLPLPFSDMHCNDDEDQLEVSCPNRDKDGDCSTTICHLRFTSAAVRRRAHRRRECPRQFCAPLPICAKAVHIRRRKCRWRLARTPPSVLGTADAKLHADAHLPRRAHSPNAAHRLAAVRAQLATRYNMLQHGTMSKPRRGLVRGRSGSGRRARLGATDVLGWATYAPLMRSCAS